MSSSSSGQSGSDSAAASAGSTGSQGQSAGTISFPAQTGSDGQSGRDGTTPQDGASGGIQGQQTANGGTQPWGSGDAGNSPSPAAGTAARLPGESGTDGNGRDSATGVAGSGQSGNSAGSSGGLGAPGGDYSLDTLPSGGLGGRGAGDSQAGTMTAAERARVLDERLRRGYEDFDGFILGERERAQREANEAGSVAIGQQGDGQGQGGAVAANQPQTMPSNGASTSGVVRGSPRVARSGEPAANFPPPEDIPSGRDDDVVARQLREAAMSEPDPELRAALWDEYRRYTGLPVPVDEGDDQ